MTNEQIEQLTEHIDNRARKFIKWSFYALTPIVLMALMWSLLVTQELGGIIFITYALIFCMWVDYRVYKYEKASTVVEQEPEPLPLPVPEEMYLVFDPYYVLGSTTCCQRSNRTLDIPFRTLATDKELLKALNLLSLYDQDEKQFKFFAYYISAFNGERKGLGDRLLANPTVMLLITDETLRARIEELGYVFNSEE